MTQFLDTAVILAAGAGSKFWPYNVVRQKATFPIANVPAIRRLVDALSQLGIRRQIVVLGHGAASVRAALRGSEAELIFVTQANATGTAPAVLSAAAELDDAPFLVVAGDVVTAPENLVTFLTVFSEAAPLAAAMIDPLGNEPAQSWLIAHSDGHTLHGISGHDRGGRHRLAGIYAFQPQALNFLRDNPGLVRQVPVGAMPPLEADIAQSLQMMVEEGETVLTVETIAYHIDLDKPWHILEANDKVIAAMQAISGESMIPGSAQIHDDVDIQGRLFLGENTVIGKGVSIRGDLWLGDGASVTHGAILEGPTVVGAGTRVRDYALIGGETSLGPNGVYGHGAEFTGVALETVYCYHYCEIWGVVGAAVDFGAATVCGNLRFDDAETVWRVKGRAEVPTTASNAAYFGDYCRTGVNAIIMPGRRIGVYACVGPGVIAYDDVPDRELLLLKQDLIRKPWGPERYGW